MTQSRVGEFRVFSYAHARTQLLRHAGPDEFEGLRSRQAGVAAADAYFVKQRGEMRLRIPVGNGMIVTLPAIAGLTCD